MDKYENKMEKIEDTNLANAQEDKLGEHIESLLTPKFLKAHSKFDDVEELYDKLGIHLQEDFERTNNKEIDKVVNEYTDFETFSKMIEAAKKEV